MLNQLMVTLLFYFIFRFFPFNNGKNMYFFRNPWHTDCQSRCKLLQWGKYNNFPTILPMDSDGFNWSSSSMLFTSIFVEIIRRWSSQGSLQRTWWVSLKKSIWFEVYDSNNRRFYIESIIGRDDWTEQKKKLITYFSSKYAGAVNTKYAYYYVICKAMSLIAIVSTVYYWLFFFIDFN